MIFSSYIENVGQKLSLGTENTFRKARCPCNQRNQGGNQWKYTKKQVPEVKMIVALSSGPILWLRMSLKSSHLGWASTSLLSDSICFHDRLYRSSTRNPVTPISSFSREVINSTMLARSGSTMISLHPVYTRQCSRGFRGSHLKERINPDIREQRSQRTH